MKNSLKTVVLMRSVRTADKGWIRRAVVSGKGRNWEERIDADRKYFGPDVVDLGGYQIRRYENGKTRYEPGGDTYAEAVAVFNQRVNRLNVQRAAEVAGVELPAEVAGSPSLLLQTEAFCAARAAKGRHTSIETKKIYRIAVEEFVAITAVRYAKDVDAAVLIAYLAGLRKRGLSQQTISNRYVSTGAVLRFTDKSLADLLREYKPAVPKRKKVSYTEEELEAFLAFLRARPKKYAKLALVAETYFKTGLRNKELAFLSWDVIDLKNGFIRNMDNRQFTLRGRGGRGLKKVVFRTKARRDREVGIPIPDGLLGRLRAWRDAHPNDRFVFPTWNGNPDHTFRVKIRTAICHAGMTCGVCDACMLPCGRCRHCRCKKCARCRERSKCSKPHHGAEPCTRIECRKWKIHNFRHSFITIALQRGVDVSTVKDVAGHADLRTTNGYLSVIAEARARENLNRVFSD